MNDNFGFIFYNDIPLPVFDIIFNRKNRFIHELNVIIFFVVK